MADSEPEEEEEEEEEFPTLNVDDDVMNEGRAERIAAREREVARREELAELYKATLERAEEEGAADDWSELRPAEQKTFMESAYEMFTFGAAAPQEPDAVPDDEAKARVVEAATHWTNYDISASLAPNLISEEEFLAARKIANVIRIFNRRRAAKRKAIGGEVKIMEREATKIKRIWRGYRGRQEMRDEKQKSFEGEKEWKAYEDFRNALLGKGYSLSRWSHSKKALIPCVLSISKDRDGRCPGLGFHSKLRQTSSFVSGVPRGAPTVNTGDWLIMKQNAYKRAKRRRLKDIHTVTRGYASPFLRDLLVAKNPEKVLSLLLRNGARGGKEESIDLMFELQRMTTSQADGAGSVASDGKFMRNKFIKNFQILQSELESDDAFFFNADGVYCQVGRSVFDRWEQVTFVDPNWDKEVDEDERRVRLKRKYNERLRRTQRKSKPFCFEPHPLPEGLKPQDDPQYAYGAEDEDGRQVRATWYSQTVEIDYGQFAAERAKRQNHHHHHHKAEVPRETVWRKEVFTLQACGHMGQADEEAGAETVPLYGRHRPGFRKVGPNDPVPAPLTDLKPYFVKQIQEVYGDLGVGGWRNRDDGTFELEPDAWRALCGLCDKGTKDQKTAGHKLLKALGRGDGDEEDEAEKKGKRLSVLGGKEGTLDSEARLSKLKVAVLNILWKKKDQKEGKMWHASARSYNTAQKKKIQQEKVLAEVEARARIERVRAEEEAAAEAERHEFGEPEDLGGGEAWAELEDAAAGDDEELKEDVEEFLSGAPTPHFDVVVLELSKKGQPPLPLGITCEKVPALPKGKLWFRDPKGHRVEPEVALHVIDVGDDAPASVSNAHQNEILRVGDYIVGVNGAYPKSVDELVQATEKSRKRRVIAMARPKQALDEDDDAIHETVDI